MAALDLPAGVTIDGAIKPGFEKVLTKEAVAFIADLQRKFNARREELLALRVERQKRLDAGEKPDFLPETAKIRESDWTVELNARRAAANSALYSVLSSGSMPRTPAKPSVERATVVSTPEIANAFGVRESR